MQTQFLSVTMTASIATVMDGSMGGFMDGSIDMDLGGYTWIILDERIRQEQLKSLGKQLKV